MNVQMDEIPQVFDSSGIFQMPSDDVVEALSDERRERLETLARCAANAKAAEVELKSATAEQTKAVAANIAAEQILDRVRPKRTQTDNARDFIRQEFETAQRRR
jgi:hypothetical protein